MHCQPMIAWFVHQLDGGCGVCVCVCVGGGTSGALKRDYCPP